MTDQSKLPPSVGEFAIEDRQRLLGRIAELEEALELADRGVENCELFRQRLAKYEDADGRLVVQLSAEGYQEVATCLYVLREIGSMDADDISGDDIDLRFEDSEGRDTGCDVSIVEYAERSAVAIDGMLATLESLARELQRLNGSKWEYCPECGSEQIHHEEGDHKQCAVCYQEWFADMDYSDVVRVHLGGKYRDKDAIIERLNARISALKAQPSGVVLPERVPYETPGSEYFHGYNAGWASSLDAVARLNSSPVIGSESFCEYCGGNDEEPQGHCMDCTQPVSTGGADERAIKIADRLQGLIEEMGEDGYHGSEICIAAHDYLRNLTAPAPNHSEQVREGWQLVPRVATLDMKNAGWQEVARQGIDPELCEMQPIYFAMLAAAPSAGSQKEQGE